MKDSTQNRNDADGLDKGKGWEDPAFSWENMQDGIFGKIVEEDPDFFKEKRRRRVPVWFWFCVAILAGSGLIYTLVEDGGSSKNSIPSQPFSPKTNSPANQLSPINQIATDEQKQEVNPNSSLNQIAEIKKSSPVAQPQSSLKKSVNQRKSKEGIHDAGATQVIGQNIDNQIVANKNSNENYIATTNFEAKNEVVFTPKLSLLQINTFPIS